MFGIKKMLKDDDATGIVGAISACLPFSLLSGGTVLVETVFGGLIALISVLGGLATWIPAACCGPFNLCLGVCTIPTGICGTILGILGGLLAGACTALVDVLTCGLMCGLPTTVCASLGTMCDYGLTLLGSVFGGLTCCAPLITACWTPAVGVVAAAASAVLGTLCGALGCSLGTGITGTLGIVGSLGEIISDMF